MGDAWVGDTLRLQGCPRICTESRACLASQGAGWGQAAPSAPCPQVGPKLAAGENYDVPVHWSPRCPQAGHRVLRTASEPPFIRGILGRPQAPLSRLRMSEGAWASLCRQGWPDAGP